MERIRVCIVFSAGGMAAVQEKVAPTHAQRVFHGCSARITAAILELCTMFCPSNWSLHNPAAAPSPRPPHTHTRGRASVLSGHLFFGGAAGCLSDDVEVCTALWPTLRLVQAIPLSPRP